MNGEEFLKYQDAQKEIHKDFVNYIDTYIKIESLLVDAFTKMEDTLSNKLIKNPEVIDQAIEVLRASVRIGWQSANRRITENIEAKSELKKRIELCEQHLQDIKI